MFTELGLIAEDTGLTFDGDSRLYGTVRGYGTVVTDTGELYRVEMFCDAGDSGISGLVTALGESLPKNTIVSQSREWSYVLVTLNRNSLLQENIVYLAEFLDKLAAGLEGLGAVPGEYKLLADDGPKPVVKPVEGQPPDGTVRVKLGFDIRSVLGALGALIGAVAMVVVAVLVVNVDLEINTFALQFEISTYALSVLTAVVTFADYRFIARKLDACGVIVSPVLTVAAVILSGFGAGVKACSSFAGVSFLAVLGSFPEYLMQNENVGSFMFGYITRGLVTAVLACILICVFYFGRHPDETVLSEKYVSDGIGERGKNKPL